MAPIKWSKSIFLMNNLNKLIKIITLFAKKKTPVYDFYNLKVSNKEEYLLLNIINNQYKNDNEAIADIYNAKNAHRYRMLKSRVLKKLYNHLFFVYNDSRIGKKEEKTCYDMLYQGKVLMHVAEHGIAEEMFSKALVIAQKHEFTGIILECYENLNFIYAQLSKYKLFYSTGETLAYYRKLKSQEDEAHQLYLVSKLELNRSVAAKKSYLPKLPAIIHRLKELWQQTNSFNIFEKYYYLNHWYLKLQGNYEESIINLENCETLLKEGKINQFRFDQRANKYAHISALLKIKQYEKGLALSPKYIKAFNPYSRNWFAFMEYYFLLAMHAGNFALANSLIFQVDNNPYFKRLKPRAVENWKLYKAYLFFMYDKTKYSEQFNFKDFILAVPAHSKDKLGYNVSIHILQFLHYLRNKATDQLIYKEDAFRKYLNLYLKDSNSERSRLFFRLLIVAIRAEFNPKISQKKGNLWLEKLKMTSTPGEAFAEIEIIPYEKLWDFILNLMEE